MSQILHDFSQAFSALYHMAYSHYRCILIKTQGWVEDSLDHEAI